MEPAVINNYGTINNNYYNTAPPDVEAAVVGTVVRPVPAPVSPSLAHAPDPAPVPVSPSLARVPDTAPVPRPVSPSLCHYKTKLYHKKTRRVLVSCAMGDGTLLGGCSNCTATFLPMADFAPFESNRNGRKRPKFFSALDDHAAAHAAGDCDAADEARTRVEKCRIARCLPCAAIDRKLTPAQKACKNEYIRMRKEACDAQNGCRYPECVERGPQAWCVLEGDHEHTKADPDEALRKEHKLSDCFYWSGNGGVLAMRREAAKGMHWPCRFCHRLEPTNNTANKCRDPVNMPAGKWDGTKEEVAQYKAKHRAVRVFPKQQHVDERKRAIGCCEMCARPVREGQEHAFNFDHLSPATKMKGTDTLAGEDGGVAGLVHNHANAATLDKIETILDREMDDLCRLLCANCDGRQTWGYALRE